MKTSFSVLFFCIVIFGITSCQEDSVKSNETIDLTDMQIEMPNLFKSPISLPEEYNQRVNFIKNAYIELNELVKKDKNIELVTFKIYFREKNSTIEDVVYHKTTNLGINADPGGELLGQCPDGWELVGTSSDPDEVARLVSEAFSGVSGWGDCQQVQVSIGWVAASVCSKDC